LRAGDGARRGPDRRLRRHRARERHVRDLQPGSDLIEDRNNIPEKQLIRLCDRADHQATSGPQEPSSHRKETQMDLRKTLQEKTGREDGFTLVELLVVIVVLGVLAAVVVFSVSGI